MKCAASFLFSALASCVAAFPHMNWESIQARQTSGNQPGKIPCTPVQPAFDPSTQYVSTEGKYAFVAPGPTDARGPCPGLNAAANHGYLPHNGIASITDLIQGTYAVFGMAQDLSGFLAVYGAIFDGNLQGYSIGGPSANLPVISGLLGTPTGLSGSHNKYENDASPIRGDPYLYGNDYLNQVQYFQQFFDKQAGVPDGQENFGLDQILEFRYERFHDSINQNPFFFNGPFSGAIASPAAYSFIYRFMANKSAEYPEGRLDRTSLMNFYAMTGTSGNFKYTPGYEKIPDNWYKRNPADDYTIPYFSCDALNQITTHPEFASIGGNLGKTNTFTGVDPSDLTGGVYNSQNLLQGNNFACFAFELVEESAPDLLEGLYTNVTPAKNLLSQAISKAIQSGGFSCPQIQKLQYSQFNKFPGYTQSYNGYSPPSGLGSLLHLRT